MEPAVDILRCLLRSLPLAPPRDLLKTWLQCAHCNALLYQPSTLGDGTSLCLSCVDKVDSKKKKSLLDGSDLHFGHSENKILSEITITCAPKLHEAARIRHESNTSFREKNYEKARLGYTKAIKLYSSDAVVWSNRSAASICLESYGAALSDSETACRLLLEQGGGGNQRTASSSLLLKCLGRRAYAVQSQVVAKKERLEEEEEDGDGKESSEIHTMLLEACCLHALVVAMYRERGKRPPATVRTRFADCFAMLVKEEESEESEESEEKSEESMLLTELTTMLGGATRRRKKRKAEDDLQEDAKDVEESVVKEADAKQGEECSEWRFKKNPSDIFSNFVLRDSGCIDSSSGSKSKKDDAAAAAAADDDNDKEQAMSPVSPLLLLDKTKLTNLRENLCCPLCFEILHQPTTIPCGHVLCRP